jgi:hypothetical protein
MIEKDPSSYSMLTYTAILLLSTWGSIVNIINKKEFKIMEALGEVFTSAFIGLLVFWLCEGADIVPLYTAALIGISSHMGSRGLFQLELILQKKINKIGDL